MHVPWLVALASLNKLTAAAPASSYVIVAAKIKLAFYSATATSDLIKRTQLVYENFEDKKPEDANHKIQLQRAWNNSIDLMRTQVEVGFDNAIFSHYFDPADKATVKKVFNAMSGNNPDLGSPNLGSIIIDNKDFDNKCLDNAGMLCYLKQRTADGTPNPPLVVDARIHCCMSARTNKVRELSGSDAITCDSLGDMVTYKMLSLSAALLHEYTHFDIIGGKNLPLVDLTHAAP